MTETVSPTGPEASEIKPNLIGPGNGNGIPEFIFTPGYDGPVITGSGRALRCRVTTNDVEIFEDTDGSGEGVVEDNGFFFFAGLDTKRDNRLQINVRNSSPTDPTVKHPDIYPKLLIARTIAYLEQTANGGQPLEIIEGNWGNGQPGGDPSKSDNWLQYRACLQAFGPGPYSPEQRVAAAAHTWTGMLATELGFTTINADEIEETIEGKHVVVLFRRSSSAAQDGPLAA